jgi:uncharacterized damage-inducible protein DinB
MNPGSGGGVWTTRAMSRFAMRDIYSPMPTHVDELRRLFGYHYWATKKLLDVVSTLTNEEWSQEVAGSYGSVRNTLVHTLSAEWGWLERCGGTPRGEKLNADDYPTPESLITLWRRIESEVTQFLATTPAEKIDGVVEFTIGQRTFRQERGQLLRHATTHAVHHRGQVALLLRALGKAPGNFDLLFYTEENHDA